MGARAEPRAVEKAQGFEVGRSHTAAREAPPSVDFGVSDRHRPETVRGPRFVQLAEPRPHPGVFAREIGADQAGRGAPGLALDGAQMIALGEWAQHIVTFRGGAATYIADAHWIFKTHVFLGMTLILLTPFTRLVHVWSIPVGYLTRPYQVVRKRQRPLQYPVR